MKNKRGDCVMVGKKVTAMLLCSVLCLFNMTSVFAMENEGSVEIYEKYRNDIQFKFWKQINKTDGTNRENHVGYAIIRGNSKESAVKCLKNITII